MVRRWRLIGYFPILYNPGSAIRACHERGQRSEHDSHQRHMHLFSTCKRHWGGLGGAAKRTCVTLMSSTTLSGIRPITSRLTTTNPLSGTRNSEATDERMSSGT
jgi:hypothetical protein